jgi:arylsulfatase
MLVPFAAMGLMCLAWGSNSASTMLRTRRHVLLVTVDALRADYLSANGYDLPTSPVMDSLLHGGTSFTHAITTIARTTQALTSLLTGTYPQTNGVRRLDDTLRSDIVSLPALARARGYATVAVVSNPILAPERGLTRGFEVYDVASDGRDAAQTTATALRYLQRYGPEDAVFAWVHYVDPHVPYDPGPELATQFDPGYDGPYQLHFGEHGGDLGDGAFPPQLPKEVAVYRNPLSDKVNAHIRRLYAADVRNADDGITALLEGLHHALGDDWLVVLTADHGESLGEHQYFFDHGDYVSDVELHVPLAFVFASGDPLQGSRSVPTWVSLVDVMPTLIDLLDLHPTEAARNQFDGRSLLPALRGQPLSDRPVFAECGEAFYPPFVRRRTLFNDLGGRFRTVILDDLKLVWTPGLPSSTAYELYFLASDPGESNDLYQQASSAPEVDHLRAALDDWYERGMTGTPSQQITEADHERLRTLGYVN